MTNRPYPSYLSALRQRASVRRRRWVKAQLAAEAEQAEQAARRRSGRKTPKSSTTSAEEA